MLCSSARVGVSVSTENQAETTDCIIAVVEEGAGFRFDHLPVLPSLVLSYRELILIVT